MKQSETFLKSEGDAWHKRNKKKPRFPDPVLDAIDKLGLQPRSVLELGCGDGWRLERLKNAKCHIMGYDPSTMAIEEGKKRGLNIEVADAKEGLYFTKERYYEMIIFGFCLYLVDRDDLQMIAGLADRALKDGGHIIIHDFLDERPTPDGPYRIKYKHKEGVWSYHMDYSKLWLANPAYREVYRTYKEIESGVVVLKKYNGHDAIPELLS